MFRVGYPPSGVECNDIIVWLLGINNRHRHFQSLPQAQVSRSMTGIPYYWVVCSDASNNITAVSEVSTPEYAHHILATCVQLQHNPDCTCWHRIFTVALWQRGPCNTTWRLAYLVNDDSASLLDSFTEGNVTLVLELVSLTVNTVFILSDGMTLIGEGQWLFLSTRRVPG